MNLYYKQVTVFCFSLIACAVHNKSLMLYNVNEMLYKQRKSIASFSLHAMFLTS